MPYAEGINSLFLIIDYSKLYFLQALDTGHVRVKYIKGFCIIYINQIITRFYEKLINT